MYPVHEYLKLLSDNLDIFYTNETVKRKVIRKVFCFKRM